MLRALGTPFGVNDVLYLIRINREIHFACKVHHLVKFMCHFSWQVQYLVKFTCYSSWQVKHMVKFGLIAGADNVVIFSKICSNFQAK